jgi:alpha-galactosidase
MRTIIQYGTSLCYPLSAQSCHISVCPNHQCGRNTPFSSRGDIASLGATGYELDTTKLSEEDLMAIKSQVDKYRLNERLILDGDLYRLNNPLEENLFAVMVVSKDKRVAKLTAMRPISIPNGVETRIYAQGLDENANYHIKELDLTLSGRNLINFGLLVKFTNNDFATIDYTFEKR